MQLDVRRLMPRSLAVVALAFASVALTGCADDFGQACDMPNTPTFNAYCSADPSSGSNATCVFSNNPQCSTRICARYQGSSDFCSQMCDATLEVSECPGDAVCYTQPGQPATSGFCIPLEIYTGLAD